MLQPLAAMNFRACSICRVTDLFSASLSLSSVDLRAYRQARRTRPSAVADFIFRSPVNWVKCWACHANAEWDRLIAGSCPGGLGGPEKSRGAFPAFHSPYASK